MNGYYFVFWLASVAALFSLPLVLFCGLMCLVGRISSRAMASILALDAVLLALGAVFWWGHIGH